MAVCEKSNYRQNGIKNSVQQNLITELNTVKGLKISFNYFISDYTGTFCMICTTKSAICCVEFEALVAYCRSS
jgi:hypothetical protein